MNEALKQPNKCIRTNKDNKKKYPKKHMVYKEPYGDHEIGYSWRSSSAYSYRSVGVVK